MVKVKSAKFFLQKDDEATETMMMMIIMIMIIMINDRVHIIVNVLGFPSRPLTLPKDFFFFLFSKYGKEEPEIWEPFSPNLSKAPTYVV